ncbi:MAG TPA: MFS transporter [Bryobacteraceae bacterium]|nr:MFS transporter [Bryobacteraceae bacterium]
MSETKSGRLIVAAILAIFVYGVIAAILGTILPSLATRLTLTETQNGNIALAQAIGLIVASVSVGPLIDKRGKKMALLLGLALIAIALFALPSAPGFGLVAVLMFLLGTGGGVLVTAANALASDIGEDRRASVLNLLNLFFGLGGLVTPFVAANMMQGDKVNLSYAAAILAAVTLAFHVMTPMPKPAPSTGGSGSSGAGIFGRPVLYLLSLFLFLYVSCEVGVWNWLAKYLIARGLEESRALNVLSLGFALGLLIGRVVVSRVLIKVQAVTVTLAAAILMVATTYLMLQSSDPTIAWVAVFCAGIAMAPVFPTTLAMVGDAFPQGTATAMGFVITCGWVGLAVSSPIIGHVAAASSLGSALLLIPAFSVAMILVNLAMRPFLRA